jgi:hypothetical protein
LYDDFSNVTLIMTLLFMFGCSFTFLGVYLISSERGILTENASLPSTYHLDIPSTQCSVLQKKINQSDIPSHPLNSNSNCFYPSLNAKPIEQFS